MDEHALAKTIIAIEKAAMEAWLDGNPSPFLELYDKNFSYFDLSLELRLDGWNKIRDLYKNMESKLRTDHFEMINPMVQSSATMAVLTYNLHIYWRDMLWKENCTEVYRLDDNNKWKIIHNHLSPTQPSIN